MVNNYGRVQLFMLFKIFRCMLRDGEYNKRPFYNWVLFMTDYYLHMPFGYTNLKPKPGLLYTSFVVSFQYLGISFLCLLQKLHKRFCLILYTITKFTNACTL